MKWPMRFVTWVRVKFSWLRCCQCHRFTGKVTVVCSQCGHRFCAVCRGEKGEA
jgi:hypothetical protein